MLAVWPLGEKNYWAQLVSLNMVHLYSHAVLMMQSVSFHGVLLPGVCLGAILNVSKGDKATDKASHP